MNIIETLIGWWTSHGTKILGFFQVSIAAIAAVDGLIPAGQLKYWMAALGLLTAWRGFINTKNLQ